MFFQTTLFLLAIVLIIYKYITRHFYYWEKRKVSGPKPIAFIGNIWDICCLKLSIGDYFNNLYKSSDDSYTGLFIFDEPCLFIKSPEIIKNILGKDFNYFKDRTIAFPKHDDIVANTLFVQKSPQWKQDRAKITPVLSTAKIKSMFAVVKDLGSNFVEFLRQHPGKHDAKDICNSYSIDVIAKCFFAVDACSFDKEKGHFAKVGKAMYKFNLRDGFAQIVYYFKTSLVNVLQLNFFKPEEQQFFVDIFLNIMRTGEQQRFRANNFIGTLLDINKEDPSFDYRKMAALGLQFFTAGFETSASTIAYTLYEMAINPDIQQRLRQEIMVNIEKSHDITYDTLKEMKYLEMCIMETLRKYPPLPFLDRRCDMDYYVPGTNLVIEKGIAVYMSCSAIQNDEKYFPESQKYIPNRFERNVNDEVLTYFPFGYGPRSCIGELFGMISVKLALIHVLSHFEVERLPETPVPIRCEAKSFTMQSAVGLPLKFNEILHSSSLIY